jgi:hypothetical protein
MRITLNKKTVFDLILLQLYAFLDDLDHLSIRLDFRQFQIGFLFSLRTNYSVLFGNEFKAVQTENKTT